MIQSFKNYFWHLPKAMIASVWYGFPARSLTMIGVTGTKGKTTTAHLIAHILQSTGRPVGLISTIGAFFDDAYIDTGLHVTSPDPRELQKLLRLAVKKGIQAVVLEVTSSGLDQFRVWGIPFTISVITNIAPDHLDYHGSMDRYIKAKSKLLRQSITVVLDPHSPNIDWLKAAARTHARVCTFESDPSSPLISNQRAAIKVTELLSIPKTVAQNALVSFPGVPGRFETVYDQEFRIVIDFAHTPESLDAALRKMRPMTGKRGRLIAVFGCAGERDRGRRRMGQIAAKLSDFFIVTAEDPRTERVEDISEEIARFAKEAGAEEISLEDCPWVPKDSPQSKTQFVRIPDRQEAITYAIRIAQPGDVIGLFGKGHEQSMCYGKIERPWSEHDAVKIALKARFTALK